MMESLPNDLKGAVVRTAVSLVLAAGLVVSLAACSAPTTGAAGCDPVAAGAASNAVKVSGDLGATPEVTIDGLPATTKTERTVAITGDGDTVVAGDTVTAQYTLYNGTTGEVLGATEYTEGTDQQVPVDDTAVPPGVASTLACSTVGSRVVGVIPPLEFDPTASTEDGTALDYDIVFIVDVISIAPPAVPLEPKSWTDNVPEVDLTGDLPVVTIPETDPPADLVLKVLTEGDGDVVAEGDSVTLNYQGTSWDTKTVFDQSFDGDPATFTTDAVIPGFGAALVGQKVGTTLIVSIPPKDAYGTDPNAAELGGQTLVFLIEILSIG